MKLDRVRVFVGAVIAAIVLGGCAQVPQRIEGAAGGPRYAVDASWPQPLPNNWILGQVAGIATDRDDNIWLIHRPLSLTEGSTSRTGTASRWC